MKRWLLILFCLSAQASAEILYKGNFESGKIFPLAGTTVDSFFYGAFGPNCSLSTRDYSDSNDNRVQTQYVRYGQFANAQTIRYNCDYRVLNEGKYQKPRQSLGVMKESISLKEGREYWLAFSMMLDKSWVSDYSSNVDSLFQVYKETWGVAADPRASGANAINLNEINGSLDIEFRDITDSSGNQLSKEKRTYRWPTVKGEWQDMVFHMRLCRKDTPNCNGFIDFYLNGSKEPVFSVRGTNTQSDEHKIVLNLYKYSWHCKSASSKTYSQCMADKNPTRSTANRTVYFDELMVGDSESSIQEVAPYFYGSASSTPSPPAPPEMSIQ